MKLCAKIYVSLLSAVLTLGVAFENSLVAQDASNWFSRAMSTVNDTLTSAFGEENQVAIKTLRQARQSYSDILTEETTTKIENVLLQGDEDTIKVLTRRIAKDFRKPTKSSLKSFVAWFEEWEKEGNVLISKLYRAVTDGKPEDMMLILESLFARTNYQIQGDAEKDFQYAMYIIFELLGEYVQTEKQTSNGRIDILLQTKDYVYIMEIKTDSSADAALLQIEEKGYARPFAADARKLFRIGVSFSKENRRIEDWKII